MLLAIDTATRLMSLALHDGHQLLAEQTWYTANNHTAELAPAVVDLLARCEVAVTDLTAMGVSVGPGSFTGLRIGVALAKGMAAAQHLPLVGVSTLDTLAAGQPPYLRHALITVVEAGRGRIIAATYRWGKNQWVSRGEAQLMTWQTLLETVDGPAYITGDVDDKGYAAVQHAQTDAEVPVRIAPPAWRLRRAGFLAEIAYERLNELGNDAFDPALAAPLYVKTRDIP
ncbi:MAG: tRNA (adenosine(37)-N6)-threonylcarbamoyltransferase complex dimerization subunit type 1 TsaB [Anaerolineaceae bacterium]|nr:tRNA (adenosine(37)-N6)-threonylcarbamoyltransferase complex dimerization subunit type 1 TsaB [Anaerolineaceae bacterium]